MLQIVVFFYYIDTIPEPIQEITYTPGSTVCLFQPKLIPFVSRGILGFTLKAGGQHMQYHFFRDLPAGFQINEMFQLCLIHQDIRNSLFGIFGNVTSLDVIETLELNDICEHTYPATVKLFGKSTRIIFAQSPESKFLVVVWGVPWCSLVFVIYSS